MFACICHAVSESDVERAIDRGAVDLESVAAATGAGTSCGSCHDHLDDLIDRCVACPLASLQVA